jgi:hypothetical protein
LSPPLNRLWREDPRTLWLQLSYRWSLTRTIGTGNIWPNAHMPRFIAYARHLHMKLGVSQPELQMNMQLSVREVSHPVC